MTREWTTMVDRVPGISIRFEPGRAATGLAYGVFISVMINGQRYRPSKFFATLDQAVAHYPLAAKEVAKLRAEKEEDAKRRQALNVPELPKAPKGCTLFETGARDWLKLQVKEMNDPGTYKFYRDLLEKHLFPIMRTWPVTDEVMTLQRVRGVLKDDLFAKGLSLKRRDACRACLSAYFGWAIVTLPAGQLTRNPLKPPGEPAGKKGRGYSLYLRNPAEKHEQLKKTPNPMTTGQYEAALAWWQEHRPRFYLWFLIQGDVGPRVAEVSALKVDHLKLDQRVPQAHICQTFSSPKRWLELQDDERSKGLPEPTAGEKGTKTHRLNQYVDLSERVVTALKAERKITLARWMSAGRPGHEPRHVFINDDDLLPRRPGKKVYEAFRAACDALQLRGADGRPFVQGDLRDTFATLAILRGEHIGWVANQMGDDEGTVREHYYKWVRVMDASPFAGAK